MSPEFTPFQGALGGALIGLAAVTLMLANGRIAGVSGIVAGLSAPRHGDIGWRIAFVAGLCLGAFIYALARGGSLQIELQASLPIMIAAGLLVGFGTRLGSGCTSGHGICGIARFSPRSLLATVVFMASAFVTVFVTRHVL
jgi:uncharacterized protein